MESNSSNPSLPINSSSSNPTSSSEKVPTSATTEIVLEPLPKPKWDEVCFQWCKQQDRKRKENKIPDCRMICFKRLLDQNRNILFTTITTNDEKNNSNNNWKVKLRKIDDIDGNNSVIAKALYGKDTSLNDDDSNDDDYKKGKSNNIERRNFLDGYCIYYVKGLENCDKHVESMKSVDSSLNQNLLIQNKSEEYEIDLGDKIEQAKIETTRVIKRAFTPGFQLAKRYFESWSDGTQFSFIRKFYQSAQRMDAVHLVQENIKKAVDVWVKGNDDEDNDEDNDGKK